MDWLEAEIWIEMTFPNPLLLTAPRTPGGANAFEVLGVSPRASPQEVKQAYLYLARRYHPDINHSAEAGAIFRQVNQAYAYITTHRDLTELMLKCKMVKTKEEYAEGLQIFKKAKLFAGIEPIVAGGQPTGEMGQRMQKLGMYLLFKCPSCQRRQRCDHATRFDEVEDIHQELMAKSAAQASAAFGQALNTLFDAFFTKANTKEKGTDYKPKKGEKDASKRHK